MHTDIEERTVDIAHYIIDKKATVRSAAKYFGVSKSTVHKDVAERLLKIQPALAQQVREERHLRGGEATRKKYDRRRS